MSEHFVDFEHPWVQSQQFLDLSAHDLMNRVLSQPRISEKPQAWVLDLDSTLFCVASRSRSIYGEFLRSHPCPPSAWCRALPHLNALTQLYDVERTFREIFQKWDAQTASAQAAKLWQEYEPFWERRFFSNRHLHRDTPYADAVAFVHAVRARGFQVVYMTGRDSTRNAPGTSAALKQAGFPFDAETLLVMKPDPEQADLEFKHQAATVLRSRFDVRVYLDNEPENLVMAAREFPQSEIVLFHSVMSARVPLANYSTLLAGRSAWRLKNYSLGQQ